MTATNTWGVSSLLSERITGINSTNFYTFDERGNVAQRTGSGGSLHGSDLYDGYGRSRNGSPGDVWGFGGQWGDYTDAETGLVLMTHRFYDPQTGRFTTRDPLGYGGGLNLYAYCGNDPINRIDPLGFCGGPDGGDGGGYGDGLSGLWPDRLKSWTDNTIPSGPSIPGVFNNPLDIVKGLLDLPSNVEHLGSQTGQHFGDPGDYGWGGVMQDALTFGTVVTAGMGGAAGAGATSRAITAADLGVSEDVFSILSGKITVFRGTMTVRIENVAVADGMKGQANILGWGGSLQDVALQAGANNLKFEGVQVGNSQLANILVRRYGGEYTPQRTIVGDIPLR